MKKEIFPLSLKKLFEVISQFEEKDLKAKRISNKLDVEINLARKYEKTVKWLLRRLPKKPESFDEFKQLLLKFLNDEYCLEDVLKEIASKKYPFNKYLFRHLIMVKCGRNVDTTVVLALIRWAKEMKLFFPIRTIEYTPTMKDLVYAYICSRGEVAFSSIEDKFPNARLIVLELWKEGLIDIEGIEELKIDPELITDFDRIPADFVPKDSKFVNIWIDERTGEQYASITLPARTRVKIKWIRYRNKSLST